MVYHLLFLSYMFLLNVYVAEYFDDSVDAKAVLLLLLWSVDIDAILVENIDSLSIFFIPVVIWAL